MFSLGHVFKHHIQCQSENCVKNSDLYVGAHKTLSCPDSSLGLCNNVLTFENVA